MKIKELLPLKVYPFTLKLIGPAHAQVSLDKGALCSRQEGITGII